MGIFHNSCMPTSSKCGYFTTLKKCVFREMEIVTEYFTNDNHCVLTVLTVLVVYPSITQKTNLLKNF